MSRYLKKVDVIVEHYSNLYSFHLVQWAQLCWSLKRLCSHSPDIHGSSIFWVMCLSNLYIKSNVSRELKLLRSENIAFCVSFICHPFFLNLCASLFFCLLTHFKHYISVTVSHSFSVCSLKTILKMENRYAGQIADKHSGVACSANMAAFVLSVERRQKACLEWS